MNSDFGLFMNNHLAIPAPATTSVSEAGSVDPAVTARNLSKDDKPTSKPKSKKPPVKTGHDDISRESNFGLGWLRLIRL